MASQSSGTDIPQIIPFVLANCRIALQSKLESSEKFVFRLGRLFHSENHLAFRLLHWKWKCECPERHNAVFCRTIWTGSLVRTVASYLNLPNAREGENLNVRVLLMTKTRIKELPLDVPIWEL